MISECDYTGPPPREEPACEQHPNTRLEDGECPVCREEAKADEAMAERRERV